MKKSVVVITRMSLFSLTVLENSISTMKRILLLLSPTNLFLTSLVSSCFV
ncbi:unnamed protein product [Brassica rapa subsp. trilocularis]